MCVLKNKTKNHDQGKYKLEKKMKTVAGVRDTEIELRYGDLFESYRVTTVEQRI